MKTLPFIPLEDISKVVELAIKNGKSHSTIAGLPEISRLIGCGLEVGNVGVICGRTGTGKTTYGLQILRSNAQFVESLPVRMASFDLPSFELDRRYLRALTYRRFCVVAQDIELQQSAFQSGFQSGPDFIESLDHIRYQLLQLHLAYNRFGIWDLSSNAVGGADEFTRIEDSYSSDASEGEAPEVIVVDSLKGVERLAHMRLGNWTASQRMNYLKDFASRLKKFAVRSKCAIWLVIDAGDDQSQEAAQGLAFDPLTRAIRKIASAWIGIGPVQRHPESDRVVVTCERENGGSPTATVLYVDFDTQHFRSHPNDLDRMVNPDNPDDEIEEEPEP